MLIYKKKKIYILNLSTIYHLIHFLALFRSIRSVLFDKHKTKRKLIKHLSISKGYNIFFHE